jgi:L-fuculose-phosphate aldolase
LSEKQAGEQLAEYGRRLLEDGLVQGTWGNLSIRLDQDYMLCTPSGIDYERLGPEDMVKVKISDLSYEGEQKPTSEKRLHAGIYTSRSDARAVIHTHSKNCSVFAAAEMPLQVEPKECRERIGELIRVAKYGRPGTRKLCKRTLAALGNSPGVLMAHHGMICCGSDLEEAYEICQQIEKAAKAAIDARLE